MDHLKRVGIIPVEGENALSALQRHAKLYKWKKETVNKHKEIICDNTLQSVEAKLSNLEMLNQLLSQLGLEPQPSKSKAKESLSKVFINIFDFDAGNYHLIHNNLNDLTKYTKKNRLLFPREAAKKQGFGGLLKTLVRKG